MMIFKNHNRLGFFGFIEGYKLVGFENDRDINDFITASKRATDWRNAFYLEVECPNSLVIYYLVNTFYNHGGADYFMSSWEDHNNPYRCVLTLNYCAEYRDVLRCLSSEGQEVIKCRCLYTRSFHNGEYFTRVSERFSDGEYFIDEHIEVFKFDLSKYPDIGYIKIDLVKAIFERTGIAVEKALCKSLITKLEEHWKKFKSLGADSGSNIYHFALSVTSRNFPKQVNEASGMLIL